MRFGSRRVCDHAMAIVAPTRQACRVRLSWAVRARSTPLLCDDPCILLTVVSNGLACFTP